MVRSSEHPGSTIRLAGIARSRHGQTACSRSESDPASPGVPSGWMRSLSWRASLIPGRKTAVSVCFTSGEADCVCWICRDVKPRRPLMSGVRVLWTVLVVPSGKTSCWDWVVSSSMRWPGATNPNTSRLVCTAFGPVRIVSVVVSSVGLKVPSRSGISMVSVTTSRPPNRFGSPHSVKARRNRQRRCARRHAQPALLAPDRRCRLFAVL